MAEESVTISVDRYDMLVNSARDNTIAWDHGYAKRTYEGRDEAIAKIVKANGALITRNSELEYRISEKSMSDSGLKARVRFLFTGKING